MKLLCLVVVVVAVVAAQDRYDGGGGYVSTYTLYDIKELTEILEADIDKVYETISDINTLNLVGDERINFIRDFFLPQAALDNEQQSDLAAQYTAQIKNLQHAVDEALSREVDAFAVATLSSRQLAIQIDDFLNGTEVAGENDVQDGIIANLTGEAEQAKEDFFTLLNASLAILDADVVNASDKINILGDFVDRNECEVGKGSFEADTNTTITFKTNFDEAPVVILGCRGYQINLDVHSYDKYDGIALDKYVQEVTADNFTVSAIDISTGMAMVERFYYTYLACTQEVFGGVVDVHNWPFNG